ncbi:DGQHR domain-containing protein DpdB [Pseudomonadales bacterium]|nr:DGQHR domain-containing protein DpdB [Pseudomonadales bacterium]
MRAKKIQIRALKTIQKKDTALYAFFIPGELITEIADISRIERDEHDVLEGFQRKAIQKHVKNITEYLDQGDILFPNAIILALSPEVKFRQSRGTDIEGTIKAGQIGTLEIPVREEGDRIAWIVDGQQRSLALAQTKNKGLNVPVVAFVAPDLEMQREQFILVNKAKPLPSRLINELLPEVDTHLPRDLAVRKIPSELCGLLNRDPESPFYGMIKRMSKDGDGKAIINDTAVIDMIKNSIKNPLGALAQYKSLGTEPSDIESMYQTLIIYWSAVKKAFPQAWGLPPTKSRLMHSAGIHSMGVLMDKIVNRAAGQKTPEKHIRDSLERIAPHCHWTSGTWEQIDMQWDDIQKIGKHLRLLSDLLNHIDFETSI